GNTIELSDPAVDNAQAEYWNLSASIGGTPGKTNSEIISTNLDLRQNNNVSVDYYLGQNYPNPFNPTTNIAYSIPESGHINLSIYDVLGNEVLNLINEYKTIGNYSISFNAGDLSSGIYFYTIKSGRYMKTKKMLLIK
ncbi:MAG: T9SS type A sorting domain-containing protein, partial [Melioribacteraceae bacterium]|nr:T9SS type A sorting domain-containing protein [Melioribacteraceae bacterium]